MSTFVKFSESEISTAAHCPIKTFLEAHGEQVKKSGTEYMWKKHDSVKFRGHVWYQHSTGEKGTAIDFLRHFYNLSFPDAVIELLRLSGGFFYHHEEKANNIQRKKYKKPDFALPKKSKNMKRIFAYLCKSRSIDNDILSCFVEKKLIYESEKRHNAVFIGCNKNGSPSYAALRGTLTYKSFKGEVGGSQKKYGFKYVGSKPQNLYVFESPIDLLSFICLRKNSDWQKDSYLSLGGLSDEALKQYLKEHRATKRIYFCLDNDFKAKENHGQLAALKFFSCYSLLGYDCGIIIPKLKDFNENLQAAKKQKKNPGQLVIKPISNKGEIPVMDTKTIIIGVAVALTAALAILINIQNKRTLNRIKSKEVGNGQHGSARWAIKKELKNSFKQVEYKPKCWRKGLELPTQDGFIIGWIDNKRVYVDTSDSNTLVISAPGGGKTESCLYPNLEYSCACGMSFLSTDTKGDVFTNYAAISETYYGYKSYVIDLRNPSKSDNYNLIAPVNKYIDLYNRTGDVMYHARAERYAKTVAKAIISTKEFGGGGQNAFFYDAAEGLIAAMSLLVAEICPQEQRHIVSVFKLIQELLATNPETVKQDKDGRTTSKTYFKTLMELLPDEHKAKWLAGTAINSPGQSQLSVISTAMSRMLSFIDSEIEQIICFNSDIDAESFVNQKTGVYIVFPESDPTKHFMVSLFIKNFYQELIEIANNNDNRLKKRVYFFDDEFGTIPAVSDVESMFSAGRSRNIMQVPMIQSTAQLVKNYGQNGDKIIEECCQNVLCSFFAPLSSTANDISKDLGNITVQTGSVSYNDKGKSSSSYQMTSKPLIFPEEIRTMGKGEWLLLKTGMHPSKQRLRKAADCGIELSKATHKEHINELKTVSYASRDEFLSLVKEKYLVDEERNIKYKRRHLYESD